MATPICDWPHGERPRERLLARGAAALSDAELVALLLRTGAAGRSALDVARDLITRFGGVAGVIGNPHDRFTHTSVPLGRSYGFGTAH